MDQALDLLIIKPHDKEKAYGVLSASLSAVEPPLWAALIAAYARLKGYSVRIIDAEAEGLGPEEAAERAGEFKPQLAGFVVTGSNLAASTWHMTGAREYISVYRKRFPEVKTFLWGLHASALPERTLREEKTDFVAQGEGFFTICELISRLKDGNQDYRIKGLWYLDGAKAVANPRAELLKNLDDLPTPAWDLLPMQVYRAHNWHCFNAPQQRSPYGVIYTSLGCPFNCSFCNLKSLFGSPGIRLRSPQKVMEDIDILVEDYQVKNIKVLDECFVLNKKHVLDICDLIKRRGYKLNIWAYARIDTVDQELLEHLKKAGFSWLCYGIESGNKSVRQAADKRGFGQEDIRRTVAMTKAAGINVLGNFMFGLPEDDLTTLQETLDLAKELNCDYANFYATMAYPGSQLYDTAVKDHLRLPKSWRGYAAFSPDCLPLPTKYLKAEEVLRFRDRAFVEFHSRPGYLALINEKFGKEALAAVNEMLAKKIERKYA